MELLDVYEILYETPIYRMSWFDPQKTIAMLEIKQAWKWDDALECITRLNLVVSNQPNPVYTVYYYQTKIPFFPQGIQFGGLRKLIQINPQNEQLVIFIRSDKLLSTFINATSKVYGLRHVLIKYRFVDTWQNALAEIHKHQSAQTS